MHTKIVKAFRNYHLFGFTGTPIFAANASSGGNPTLKTTPQAFGEKLHTYTIVDAINDGNVLPFRIDFINTVKQKDNMQDKDVSSIDTEKALSDPKRIREVVTYILDHFDQKTKRSSFYSLQGQRVAGFNSILAVSSIPVAKKYYLELKRQLAERGRKLNVATIFSYSANEADPEDVFPDEDFDTSGLDQTSRDFLESAIADYNADFNTNFDTSSDKFQNYYKDLSLRMKRREIDLLVVVNMFLTGFDATTLNTLWVDKNLRQHGLIQSFSRTNRILNSVKTFGNIVCFRNLQKETDDAIALFGDKDAGSIVLLKNYESYYNGFDEDGKHQPGYTELIETLEENYPLGQAIMGEQNQKDFIRLFGAVLRLKNILTAFDDFEGNELLTAREFQDYQSIYIDLYQDLTKDKKDKEKINDDIIFEIELIRQVEINIDYILMLVAKFHDSNCTDKGILISIDKAVNSSMQLRSKKELIEHFIQTVNATTKVDQDWKKFVEEQKESDLANIISEEKLKQKETRRLINNSFRDGLLKTTGTDIDKIMPPVSRFGGGNREVKKQNIIDRLMGFFEKYFGLV
jgi:type I restriction enzyme R subunit